MEHNQEKIKALLEKKFNTKESELPEIDPAIKLDIINISKKSYQIKGIVSVLLTSATYKTLHPNQDIRNHQKGLPSGYSGRSFDTKFIVPFCKDNGLSSPKESGWLTRSLEQPYSYNFEYKGKISKFKDEFLRIIDYIENKNSEDVLSYLLYHLKLNKKKEISHEDIKTKTTLLESLSSIFNIKTKGISKIPVLVIKLLEENIHNTKINSHSHYSSDKSSGELGDIFNKTTSTFFEIKHGILYDKYIELDILKKIEKDKVFNLYKYYYITTNLNQSTELKKLSINDSKRIDILITNINSYLSNILFNNNINKSNFLKSLCDTLEKDSDISNELYNEITKIIAS